MNLSELDLAAETKATIQYIPKGNNYSVLGKTKIKREDGSWIEGLAYSDDNNQIYDRPLSMFKDFKIVTT